MKKILKVLLVSFIMVGSLNVIADDTATSTTLGENVDSDCAAISDTAVDKTVDAKTGDPATKQDKSGGGTGN